MADDVAPTNTVKGTLTPYAVPLPLTSNLTRLQQETQARLSRLEVDKEALDKVDTKLETITDQPRWDAFIPFTPLAYFPGSLIHTNDITYTTIMPASSSPALVKASTIDEKHESGEGVERVLLSAKQARESAQKRKADVIQQIQELQATLEKQREEARVQLRQSVSDSGSGGVRDDWTIGDSGEVINEEGLPMFDIREELPPVEVENPSVQSSQLSPARESEVSTPKAQMRYLIKRGGKQVVRPLNVPASGPVLQSPALSSTPASTPKSQLPSAHGSSTTPQLDTQAILDELEREEREKGEMEALEKEEEAAATAAAEEPKGPQTPSTNEERESRKTKKPSATSAPAPLVKTPPPASKPVTATAAVATSATLSSVKPTPKSQSTDFLSGFSSGFLSKASAAKTKPTASPSASTSSLSSLATPKSTTTPLASKTSTQDDGDGDEPKHEPHHRSLPPSELKSIYRPTPPGTPLRPSSPAPNSPTFSTAASVKFDLPSPSSEDAPEQRVKAPKKAAIILGPPPSSSLSPSSADDKGKGRAADQDDDEPRLPMPPKKTKAQTRPVKDVVVEREVKPPVAPGVKAKPNGTGLRTRQERDRERWKRFGGPVKTLRQQVEGQARAGDVPKIEVIDVEDEEKLVEGPVHTLDLSTSTATEKKTQSEGHASLNDLLSSDDDNDAHDFGADEEEGDEDPDAFYAGQFDDSDGDDDDFEDDDFDIDAALEQREAALMYHEARMKVGAGAGTGPLGGDREPDAYDAWNQPVVPANATAGKSSSHGEGHSSRFRTGRLESARMIIPSLLAANIRQSSGSASHSGDAGTMDGSDDDDDDGFDAAEREEIRKRLEGLGNDQESLLKPYEGSEAAARAAVQRQKEKKEKEKQQLAETRDAFIGAAAAAAAAGVVKERAPPVVKSVATPKPTPLATKVAERSPSDSSAVATSPSEPKPQKKMSRFKARQLGLETEA